MLATRRAASSSLNPNCSEATAYCADNQAVELSRRDLSVHRRMLRHCDKYPNCLAYQVAAARPACGTRMLSLSSRVATASVLASGALQGRQNGELEVCLGAQAVPTSREAPAMTY